MQTALVHDWLIDMGGSEKVLMEIYKLYPSPIYTLIASSKSIDKTPLKNAIIHQSFISKFPFAIRKYRSYLPFFPLAIEQFNLSSYDLIISSSHAVAKGILKNQHQIHICYCHTPIRYAWDLYFQYLHDAQMERGIKSIFARMILHYIRMWDISTVNRVDYYIANSNYIKNRIKKLYNKEATVIYPPVFVDQFSLTNQKDNYYVTASRLVPYKKIELIVEAFNQMPERKLLVIGDGPQMRLIKKIAKKNIELLGYQPSEKLNEYLQKAKAFIYAAEEDFGILPVEAQACGTPVIAYNRGGVSETVIDNKTGVFFDKQSVDSIIDAVKKFEKMEDRFNPSVIRDNALRFSDSNFRKHFSVFVQNIIQKHKLT